MHPHTHHPIVAFIVLALFFFGFMSAWLSSIDVTEFNRQIAEALLDAFRATGYQQKEIYMAMHYSKGQWSKVMSGEKSLSLVRLQFCTPFKFYVKVWERLLAIKARDFAADERADAAVEQRVRTNAA